MSNPNEIQILLTARNQANQAFAEFSKSITDVAANLLKSAEASATSSKAQTEGGTTATAGAKAHRDLSDAVTENAQAHEGLTEILGPFVSKYLEARTIFEVAKSAYQDYTEFLRNSVGAYAEAEIEQVRLVAAMKAQGDASPALIGHYEALATQLMKNTTVSDEAAKRAEALFIQIGNVGPDMMERAMKAAADYSASTGKSFESSALVIAKAAEGNIGALQRYGIQITKSQVDLDGMGAVFSAIEKQMGGQSDAITGTLLGSWEQLGNRWNEAEEQLGGRLAPTLAIGIKALNGLIGIVEESPDAFAAFVVGSTAVAASLAWIGLADLFGDKLSRLSALVGGPLTQNVSLFATENAVAQGSVLGLASAEVTLETETVAVTGSILGLSGAATTAAVAEEGAATATLALASAAGIAQVALGALVVIPLSVMVGEWLGKITGLTDAIQHLVGGAGDLALATETAGAKQDTINRAVSEGAPKTIAYAEAVQYLTEKHTKASAGQEALTESSKKFASQVDAVVASVTKGANSGAVMDQAFQMLSQHGLTDSADAVSKLWPQVDKLVHSGVELTPQILAWHDAWKGFMEQEGATKKFDSAVAAMVARLEGDAGPSIKIVTAAFRDLSPAQRESSDVIEALTPIIQKFLDKGQSLPPLLRAWADEHDVVTKAVQKHRAAMEELESIENTHAQVIPERLSAVQQEVEHWLRLGASVGLVAKAYGDQLTPAQVKAIDDMMKANDKYAKSWASTEADIEKLWDEALMIEKEQGLKGLDLAVARLNAQQVKEEDAAKKRVKDEDQLQQELLAIQKKYDGLRNVAITKDATDVANKTQQLWLQYYDTLGQHSANTVDYQIQKIQEWYDKTVETAIAAGISDKGYYTALAALADAKMQEVYQAHDLTYQAVLKMQTDLAGGWQQSFVNTIVSTGDFGKGFEAVFNTIKSDVEGIFASMLSSIIEGFLKPLLKNVSDVASNISSMLMKALTGDSSGTSGLEGRAINWVMGGASTAAASGLSATMAGITASEAAGAAAAAAAGMGVGIGGIATGGIGTGLASTTIGTGMMGSVGGTSTMAGTAGGGSALGTAATFLATNPIGWAIDAGIAALLLWNHFSGPDKNEIAGREVKAQWESDLWTGLSASQKAEASGAGWANPQDAGALIFFRDQYATKGRSNPEQSAEHYLSNVWDTIPKGYSAMHAAIQDVDSYDIGGPVPGPIGAPRKAIVHGGEFVLTPQMQADLLSKAGSGDIVIHHQTILDGKVIDARIERVAREKIRSGSIRVPKRSVTSRG